jgi:prepilin-type N-terminal cleavage/methylation domain-containing protein
MSVTPRFSSERGFTLTELVIAMALGMIVLLAAFTVIDRSFANNKAVQDREDALQRGRITLELMTREIRSMTCAGLYTPVTKGTDNEIDFYGYMGDPTAGGSTLPQLHKLVYDPTAMTISETDYPVTSVGDNTTPPTVSNTPSVPTKVLLNNVVPVTGVPIFSYYTFDPTATQGTGAFVALNAGSTGLSTADQVKVVKVAINFLTRPTGIKVNDPHSTTFQDDVFWRAVDPESPNAQPCSQGT